jgi:hypothetical protein
VARIDLNAKTRGLAGASRQLTLSRKGFWGQSSFKQKKADDGSNGIADEVIK